MNTIGVALMEVVRKSHIFIIFIFRMCLNHITIIINIYCNLFIIYITLKLQILSLSVIIINDIEYITVISVMDGRNQFALFNNLKVIPIGSIRVYLW